METTKGMIITEGKTSEGTKKMNILVLGASGAGKSTLIKAISGCEVKTGVGEGVTQKIDVYNSSTWDLRLIDTKGFEYKRIAQINTIRQIKKYIKEYIINNPSERDGIDAIWFCIEGTSRRIFADNIEMMNKAAKGWKNIPVFVVITKSYSETDIPENIEAVKKAFYKIPGVNLKEIIPVVAENYTINNETTVNPMGILELCETTLKYMNESKEISRENLDRMILEQKRFTANTTVAGSTATAVAIGAIPIPVITDSALLVPLETGLTKAIYKIYGVKVSSDLIQGVVGSAAITMIAKSIIKVIPVVGPAVNAAVAGVLVAALGEGVIASAEAIYKGKISPEQFDVIYDFIADKMKTNPIIKVATEYIINNADKLKNKTGKEIFTSIIGSSKNLIEKK